MALLDGRLALGSENTMSNPYLSSTVSFCLASNYILAMPHHPRYLTGDKKGINDFIDKFDVRSYHLSVVNQGDQRLTWMRSFCSIATVCRFIQPCESLTKKLNHG